MAKKLNWQREYFEGPPEMQATLSDQQQDLLREIKALEQTMYNRKHDTRFTAAQNAEFREEKLYEIQTRFYAANEKMYAQLQQEAEAHRADFLRRTEADTSRLLLEQRRWENRYAGMNEDQLSEEAGSYATEQEPSKLLSWTPDRLESLTAALARRKGSMAQELRKEMERKEYNQPWKYEKPEFHRAMKLYTPEYGAATVLNSFGELEKVDIAGVYMEKDSMQEGDA